MRDSGQYDLLIWNVLVANTGDPENYLRENWYSTSANNTSGYANSEVDKLLDQLASDVDSNARPGFGYANSAGDYGRCRHSILRL